jgi:hypothetical protein
MPRKKINRISAIVPCVMSLSAFVLVLVAVATGWDNGLKDGGSAAHIYRYPSLSLFWLRRIGSGSCGLQA